MGSECRLIIVAYRPPEADNTACDYLNDLLNCTRNLLDVKWPSIVAGDFNAAQADWSSMSPCDGKIEQLLSNFALFHSLQQVVTEPTRNDKPLDVVLTNEPHIVSTLKVEPTFSTSDHCLIQFMHVLESVFTTTCRIN